MKVTYEIIYYKPETTLTGIQELKAIETIFCCEKMEEVWGDCVAFGEYGGWLNKDKNVNIYSWDIYPEGAWQEMVAIDFCPFCGKKIEVLTYE